MTWSDLPIHPKPRILRQFAGGWLVFFLGAAAVQGLARGHHRIGVALAVLAVAVGILGLTKPAAIRWIFVGMMVLAFPIGWCVTQVLLAILFFGIFTPMALIFRFKGRDPLCLKLRSSKTTYWQTKTTPQALDSYFRQF